ncbi:hypothetical protein AMJ40_02505 [candidate division TA06 bacterium DG_26]|uniref:Lipopolysaccharide export system permease protein LptF n=1 Tax=candidate division TA06 bacterium DG_26 TaxID=1703771 RepID=A0A0S7WK91_UNCT6|nr:MAG: hypothetical protein AMJ40_02505 [candidate division TA06 bacterium DG_26]
MYNDAVRIIYRYILVENLSAFILGVLLLTFILMMDRFFDLIDLIIGKGLDPLTVLETLVLSLPFILALTIPMAVLVGTIVAFGRLSQDRELIALQASGIGFFSCALPVILAAAALACGLVFFNNYILPESNHKMKNLMIDISQKKPAVKIREGIFIPDFPGYQIYIEHIDPKHSKVSGVTIYETGSQGTSRIISARDGEIEFSAGKRVFTVSLSNGEIHDIDTENPERSHFLRFKKHTINIPMDIEMVRRERDFRSDRELSAGAMLTIVHTLKEEIKARKEKLDEVGAERDMRLAMEIENQKRQMSKYLVEIHKKYAIPVACIVFVLVGAPVGYHLRRGGLGIGMGVSIGFFLLYYVGLIAGEEIADRALVSPWLAMWLPNMILGAAGVALTYLTNRGVSIRFR